MALLKSASALATFVAAGMWVHAAVKFWERTAAPTLAQKLLSCFSPEVVEGATAVFLKALVVDTINRTGGQTNPDWAEGAEMKAGKCVDDLRSDFAKGAECTGWLTALNEIHLLHIAPVNQFNKGHSCHADGVADGGPVVWEFEYVFQPADDGKSFYVGGRLTGQWHLKQGINI